MHAALVTIMITMEIRVSVCVPVDSVRFSVGRKKKKIKLLISFSVESIETLSDTGRSTPRLSPPKKEAAGAPYRSTRFGFRLNRPASTGLTAPKNASCENVVNNNHSEAKLNGKNANKTSIKTAAIFRIFVAPNFKCS